MKCPECGSDKVLVASGRVPGSGIGFLVFLLLVIVYTVTVSAFLVALPLVLVLFFLGLWIVERKTRVRMTCLDCGAEWRPGKKSTPGE